MKCYSISLIFLVRELYWTSFLFYHCNFPSNISHFQRETLMPVWLRASPARGQSSGAETGPTPTPQSSPLNHGTSESAPSILLAQDQTHLGHFDVITVKCILLPCMAEVKRKQDHGLVRSPFSLSLLTTPIILIAPINESSWIWPCLHTGLQSWHLGV